MGEVGQGAQIHSRCTGRNLPGGPCDEEAERLCSGVNGFLESPGIVYWTLDK